jgi:hypothetical protein
MELQLQKKISMELENVNIHPGLSPPDISRIQPSLRIVASQGEPVSIRFYDLLFLNFPERQSFISFEQCISAICHVLERITHPRSRIVKQLIQTCGIKKNASFSMGMNF